MKWPFSRSKSRKKSKDVLREPQEQTTSASEELPEHITGKYGAEMVLIPAGEFRMGDHFKRGYLNVRPVHKVYLDAFYMSKYEVTIGQYKEFVKATGHRSPDWDKVSEYSATDRHPITYVSWDDAAAYCKWAGGRLPTEAEWEKAARGGLVGKEYLWGNDEKITPKNANYDDNFSGTTPVGNYPSNGYGLYDMAGNVWEWCADWYAGDYYARSPKRNPTGPASGTFRVLRGGSWGGDVNLVRTAFRNNYDPTCTCNSFGFRFVSETAEEVVRSVPTTDVSEDLPERITGKDEAEMVLIPAGKFEMGSNNGHGDEKPVHTVYVDAFYMDIYQVTNAQYREFITVTGRSTPKYWGDPKFTASGHPVVGVTWHDADAYAKWAGKCLPTEAKWEKAARGGLVGMQFPWGNGITEENVNYSGSTGGTTPVGSFPPNSYGLYDMSGNVWEWCTDWHDSDYYARSPKRNPAGPDSGSHRVLRGGSWYHSVYNLRVATRSSHNPSIAYNNVGFRCCASLSD